MININCAFAGNQTLEATKGAVMCGGIYNKLTQTSVWNLRNFNVNQSIFLESFKFFDATGMIIYNSTTNSAGIPASNNGC